jgi:hypothetical protein
MNKTLPKNISNRELPELVEGSGQRNSYKSGT